MRKATIYIAGSCAASAGIKTLLKNNGIDYVEVDAARAADAQSHSKILSEIDRCGVPLVELDGKLVPVGNIPDVARALGLRLQALPGPPTACC